MSDIAAHTVPVRRCEICSNCKKFTVIMMQFSVICVKNFGQYLHTELPYKCVTEVQTYTYELPWIFITQSEI